MDEQFWDMCCEETVACFCSGDDCSNGDILVVKHQVLNEETFTGITASNENDDWAFVFIWAKTDGLHLELREFQIHCSNKNGKYYFYHIYTNGMNVMNGMRNECNEWNAE